MVTCRDEAIDAMVRPGVEFTPDRANHDLYRRLGEVYRDIREHTDGIYRRSYDVFG